MKIFSLTSATLACLLLLPVRVWQQWRQRHHDGFEQFRQRTFRERDDGESLH